MTPKPLSMIDEQIIAYFGGEKEFLIRSKAQTRTYLSRFPEHKKALYKLDDRLKARIERKVNKEQYTLEYYRRNRELAERLRTDEEFRKEHNRRLREKNSNVSEECKEVLRYFRRMKYQLIQTSRIYAWDAKKLQSKIQQLRLDCQLKLAKAKYNVD